jgi:DNA-binding LytR/AlgR family response regulator
VRRHPRDQEQRRRIDAYLTGADDEEKGRVMMALFGHAVIFVLLSAVEAIWVGFTAVRVWRRREMGLARAARTGVHKPTLVVLLAAHVLYEVLRKAGVAKLDRRGIEYAAHKRGGI